MDHLSLASAILLAAFAGLAAIDGLYLHLWRYRLHAMPSARREHLLHTIHGVLFIPMLLFVFGDHRGPVLWLGALAAVAGLVVVAWDSVEELRSRSFQRGLPRGEATLHALLHTLQIGAVVLSLAAHPLTDWHPDAANGEAAAVLGPATWVAYQVLPGAVVVALVHVILALAPHLLPARPALPPSTAVCC